MDKLSRTEFDKGLIIQEQEAIKELGNKDDFVIDFETCGKMLIKPKVVEKLLRNLLLVLMMVIK